MDVVTSVYGHTICTRCEGSVFGGLLRIQAVLFFLVGLHLPSCCSCINMSLLSRCTLDRFLGEWYPQYSFVFCYRFLDDHLNMLRVSFVPYSDSCMPYQLLLNTYIYCSCSRSSPLHDLRCNLKFCHISLDVFWCEFMVGFCWWHSCFHGLSFLFWIFRCNTSGIELIVTLP